jgi:hypothetical protein
MHNEPVSTDDIMGQDIKSSGSSIRHGTASARIIWLLCAKEQMAEHGKRQRAPQRMVGKWNETAGCGHYVVG